MVVEVVVAATFGRSSALVGLSAAASRSFQHRTAALEWVAVRG